MRSRAARLTSSAVACLALGGAAWFVSQTEHSLALRRTALRHFDLSARDAVMAVVDARMAQQAYVASGQSASFWMPKVSAAIPATTDRLDNLRQQAADEAARRSLLESSATLAEFATIDKRARDYLAADQPLMAADVVFSEGVDSAAAAVQQIEAARLSELQAFDADEIGQRRRQAFAVGGACGFTALLLLLMSAFGVPAPPATEEADGEPASGETLMLRDTRSLPARSEAGAPVGGADELGDRAMLALNSAADVCTAFGCVQDLADLQRVLARAATLIDASGLVVWLGNGAGADLRPVVAHGYSEQVLALMRPVPRHADNAAATAYRTGTLQIVPAKPGTSLGAVVAPLVSADGCVGALTAEIKDNGEVSETVHALSVIFASQLAGVLSASTQAAAPDARVVAS